MSWWNPFGRKSSSKTETFQAAIQNEQKPKGGAEIRNAAQLEKVESAQFAVRAEITSDTFSGLHAGIEADTKKHAASSTNREVAGIALKRFADAGLVDPIVAALRDSNLRREAACELVNIGTPAAERLIAAFQGTSDKAEDVELLEAMARILGEIGDARPIEPLIAKLDSGWVNVQRAAEDALVKIGVPAVEALINTLNYGSSYGYSCGGRAARVLGLIGDTRAVSPLITALGSSRLGQDTVEALVTIGAPAVDALVAALTDKRKSVREGAQRALDKIGWQPSRDEKGAAYWLARKQYVKCVEVGSAAVGPLMAALRHDRDRDDDDAVREAAAKALGQIGDARAVESLVAALRNEPSYDYAREAGVRRAAADALDRIGWRPAEDENAVAYWVVKKQWENCVRVGAPAVEPLVHALQDNQRDVREAASRTLIAVGMPAVKPLIASLGVNDQMAKEALVAIGEPAVVPLIEVLNRGDKFDSPKSDAAEVLGLIGDTRAVEPLISRLKGFPTHSGDRIREVAARALGQIADIRAVEPLIAVLKICDRSDSEGSLHRELIDALGRFHDARALELFVLALKDTHYSVRKVGANALGRIGGSSAVNALIPLLSDLEIGGEAADALGQTGDPRATLPLVEALKTKGSTGRHSHLRGAAAEALSRIGLPAAEPLEGALGYGEDYLVRQAAAEVLHRIGWKPSADQTGANYYAIKEQWERCVEIGALAIEPVASCLEGSKSKDEVARTLLRLGDCRGLAVIRARLEKEQRLNKDDVAAVRTFGATQREHSVALLRDALRVATEVDVKKDCVAALVRLGDSVARQSIISTIFDWLEFAFRSDIANDEDIQVLAANVGMDAALLIDGTEAMSYFTYSTKYSGTSSGGNWTSESLESYSSGMPAVWRLCSRNDLWTSCILFRVSNRKDAKARTLSGGHWIFETVSLEEQRDVARKELIRRGCHGDPIGLL